MSLLEVRELHKRFSLRRNVLGRTTAWLQAVNDVSFDVAEGETVALVGESGAGKSTVGRLVLRLIEADHGVIHFDGVDMRAVGRRQLRRLRQRIQMIQQDPFSSLDPRISVGESIGEPLLVHHRTSRRERRERAGDLLEHVGLRGHMVDRFPHELSGGQLQRVTIARALTLEPKLIVCDEPVAALDVSVRAQVLNLLRRLQDEFGIAYLFVSHDLALVEVIADRIIVMRDGEVVERGAPEAIFQSPQAEYTKQLLSAIPVPLPLSLR